MSGGNNDLEDNYASTKTKLLIFKPTINQHEARTLIDCGADDNYIAKNFVEKHHIQAQLGNETNITMVVLNYRPV